MTLNYSLPLPQHTQSVSRLHFAFFNCTIWLIGLSKALWNTCSYEFAFSSPLPLTSNLLPKLLKWFPCARNLFPPLDLQTAFICQANWDFKVFNISHHLQKKWKYSSITYKDCCSPGPMYIFTLILSHLISQVTVPTTANCGFLSKCYGSPCLLTFPLAAFFFPCIVPLPVFPT